MFACWFPRSTLATHRSEWLCNPANSAFRTKRWWKIDRRCWLVIKYQRTSYSRIYISVWIHRLRVMAYDYTKKAFYTRTVSYHFDVSIYKNARHIISMCDARCIAHACCFIFIVFIMNRGYARCSIKTNIRIGVWRNRARAVIYCTITIRKNTFYIFIYTSVTYINIIRVHILYIYTCTYTLYTRVKLKQMYL